MKERVTGGVGSADIYTTQCAEALEQALHATPFYAAWQSFDPGPAVPIQLRFSALPTLTKADIRAHFPRGFVPDGVDFESELGHKRISYVSTSGSTEDQVTLFWSQEWWDRSERASWALNDHLQRVADGHHREAVLASPRCVGPYVPGEILPTRERILGRLLFLNQTINPGRWTSDDMRRMLDELAAFRPAVLEADPFYLAALAAFALDHGLAVYQPAVVTFTYSFPAKVFLNVIRRVFHAPFVSSHGSTETGYVFMECEHGRMHQNWASCHVDYVPLEARPSGTAIGRLLVTPFRHPVQRFVRFDVGDLAELSPDACPCGRRDGLTLQRIVGRATDVTFTRAGRRMTVADADAVLSEVPEVRGFQIEQAMAGDLRARLCLAPLADARKVVREAERRLAEAYGFCAVAEAVAALDHEPSGKVRLARRTGK